jgi:hypothetical protein
MANSGASMVVVQDDIWLCDDCYLLAETGDGSSLDYYYGEEADERLEEVTIGLDKLGPHLVSDNDPETGEGIEEFSWRICDCCETSLGGSRHRMAILGEEEGVEE